MNEKMMREKEREVMDGLKNFQQATVERIDELFRANRNRVLVADEVGLGKTLIARGCIAKTGILRAEEHDQLFKIVYVCSNQNIARKNIGKLDVYGVGDSGNLSDSRLSMQHLRIVEQEINCNKNSRDAQLIPLTPSTSFRMTSGRGTVEERALMFAILSKLPQLKEFEEELEKNLKEGAVKGWGNWAKDFYIGRVKAAQDSTITSSIPYPQSILNEINNTEKYVLLINRVIEVLSKKELFDTQLMNQLRQMFAWLSVERLEPDLIIMDEFQRFKFLLVDEESDKGSEMGMIAKKFLSSDNTRVLLLSATPYKLYSTLEEMEEKPSENHYNEFMQVMHFLFNDKDEKTSFESKWQEYSETLKTLQKFDIHILTHKKECAETALYQGMCRTERFSVMNGEDFIDSKSVNKPLDVNPLEIQSYIEGCTFIENIFGKNSKIPMDYAKSCPFLLPFMSNYKLMDKLKTYFSDHISELPKRRGLLWVDTKRISDYKKLPETNARLKLLEDHLFEKYDGHKYLWIPPSLPYYPLQGVYKGSEGFSKVLLFSAWEMVPKMIGSLISYEAERRTIGEIAKYAENKEKRNTHYHSDDNRRYPYRRLQGGNEWYLLYPSQTLSTLYNPIECFNKKLSLSDIKKQIKSRIESNIKIILSNVHAHENRPDNRWYLLAPMIMDGVEYVQEWIDGLKPFTAKGTKTEKLITDFIDNGVSFNDLELGTMPSDLADVLTLMSLGSPSICIYRTNGKHSLNATDLADVFVERFNSTEGTAVVQLAYSRKNNDDSHWIDVLHYCTDGGFQAMFDEYHHMLKDEAQFATDTDIEQTIHEKMCGTDSEPGTLKIRRAHV